MRYAQAIVMMAFLAVTFYYGINMIFDAAIREEEFRENLRIARCERWDEPTRELMKGYCK